MKVIPKNEQLVGLACRRPRHHGKVTSIEVKVMSINFR